MFYLQMIIPKELIRQRAIIQVQAERSDNPFMRPSYKFSSTILPILIFYSFAFSLIPLPPPVIVPNYNRIPIGQIEASEAGAYVARASGITATWYNPAGLALTQTFALNASYNGLELMKFDLQDFSSLRSINIEGTPGFLGVVARVKSPNPLSLSIALSQPVFWRPAFDATAKAEMQGFDLSIINDIYFTTYYPAIAAGLVVNKSFRVGLGISFPYTSFNVNQSLSGHPQSTDPSDFLLYFHTNGTVLHLAASAGIQLQLTDNILFGITFRTPGAKLFNNAWIHYDFMMYKEDTVMSVSLRDTGAVFEYKQPAQLSFGLSYSKERWSFELDLNLFQCFGKYTVLRSDENAIVETFNGTDVTTVTEMPFPNYSYDNKMVINTAIGGDYRISEHLSMHIGFCTDFSPVNPAYSNTFRSINLFNITFGVSAVFKKFTGALGTRFNFGSSDSFITGKSLMDSPPGTRLLFRSFSLFWAVTLGS